MAQLHDGRAHIRADVPVIQSRAPRLPRRGGAGSGASMAVSAGSKPPCPLAVSPGSDFRLQTKDLARHQLAVKIGA
jgi:hypothetical protein